MGLYSDKLWKACRLIKEYNAKLDAMKLPEGVKPPKHIDDERFVEKLVLIGGVSDELIRQCTWEELENCGLPRLLARDVAKIFRANQVDPEYIVKRWMPLLKSWRLHWRDHMDLAEKLEKTALDEGWHGESKNSTTLSPQEFKILLELIRDHHLGKLSTEDDRILDRWHVSYTKDGENHSVGYTATKEGAAELQAAFSSQERIIAEDMKNPEIVREYTITRTSSPLKVALLKQIEKIPEPSGFSLLEETK